MTWAMQVLGALVRDSAEPIGPIGPMGWVHLSDADPDHDVDVGQNGRPRGPQMLV